VDVGLGYRCSASGGAEASMLLPTAVQMEAVVHEIAASCLPVVGAAVACPYHLLPFQCAA
jgi:hypothetical protein